MKRLYRQVTHCWAGFLTATACCWHLQLFTALLTCHSNIPPPFRQHHCSSKPSRASSNDERVCVHNVAAACLLLLFFCGSPCSAAACADTYSGLADACTKHSRVWCWQRHARAVYGSHALKTPVSRWHDTNSRCVVCAAELCSLCLPLQVHWCVLMLRVRRRCVDFRWWVAR